MKTLRELERERAQCKEKAETINRLAEEEERGLTSEEQTEFDSFIDRAETITSTISRRMSLGAVEESSSQIGRLTKPDGLDVKVGEDRVAQDPKFGYQDIGEFLTSLSDSVKRRGISDSRLNRLSAAGSDEQLAGSDPYGGFLVPRGFLPQLLTVESESDPTEGRVTQVPMEESSIDIPARTDKNHTSSVSGGLRVYRKEETQPVNSSRKKLEQITLKASELMGVTFASRTLIERSAISIAALIQAGFRDEFASERLDERINGNGVNKPLGVLKSPALIAVAKEGSQAANTIVYNNVVKMRSRCWGYQRAVWIANHDTYPQLSTLKDGDNNHVYQTSLVEDRPDILLGRPIFYSEYAQTVGSQGDLMLVDWSQYLYGVYRPLRSEESMHVRYLEHEEAFKFWIEDAGAPWWRTALTPKNSASTLSPYVTLAVRA